jgi:alkaline phosphatase
MKTNRTSIGIIFLLLLLFIGCSKNEREVDKPPFIEQPTKKNLILLIGDGMGISQITAASVVKRKPLNIERCKYVGLHKVYAADKLVPSSASTITAIACGIKTNYEYVGVNTDGKPVANIAGILAAGGYATGIITTSFIADATPAGFFASNTDRYDREGIAMDLLKSKLDIVIGGGRGHFNNRQDGLNLLDSLKARNIQVYDDLTTAMEHKHGKMVCFTHEMKPPKISEGRGDLLSEATAFALKLLEKNETGFFLMVEGAQIDWAGHDNDHDWLMDEMFDFDKAVGIALDFAEREGNTLVIVTSDHETGGYALTDGDEKSGIAIGEFVNDEHTASMVPIFATGPGAAAYAGVYCNTELFDKFLAFFGVSRR